MNLIVTCARNLEGEAEEEIMDILDELGDPDVKISVSNMSGIITVQTKLDPIEVVGKMKEILLDEPWSIRYCLRVIPIQKIVETNLEKIEECISSISDKIEDNESYRILIEKRNSDISSKEIITNIANQIKNKVSLDFPDKIILIERYLNGEAMMEHGKNVSEGGVLETHFVKFMEHFTINKIDVYGSASDELKEFLKPFGLPFYFHPDLAKFSRN